MIVNDKRRSRRGWAGANRTYPPDLLPRLQALLSDLADMDCAYDRNLDALLRSPRDEVLKREMLDQLRLRHEKRRALVLAELTLLEEQVRTFCKIEARTVSDEEKEKTVLPFRPGTRRKALPP